MTILAKLRHAMSLQTFSRGASVVVVLIGCLVLVGWALDVEFLKRLRLGWVSVKANAAFAFVLSGIALWLLQTDHAGPRTRLIAQACASIVASIGLLTLFEFWFGWDWGLDQLLLAQPLGANDTAYPGRMSSTAALNFALIGFALLLLNTDVRWGYPLAQFLALPATVISLIVLTGYAYGISSPYVIPPFSSMALHAAAAFLLLCAGIVSARPTHHPAGLLPSSRPIEQKIIIGFGVAMTVLITIIVVAYYSTLHFQEANRLVAHTHEVLAELEAILSLVKDTENVHRGYVITGDERWLEPYDNAVRLIPGQIKRVRSLTADNPEQQGRLDALELFIKDNLRFRAETIRLQRTQGIQAARRNIMTNIGKRSGEAIRQLVGEMEKHERELLTRRNAESTERARITLAIIPLGSLLALALVTAASVIILRAFAERKHAEEALRQSALQTHSIIENAYDAFVGMDERGVITAWNAPAEAIFGWSRDEALGRTVAETIIPFQHREQHQQGLQRFLATGEGPVLSKRIELMALRRDGTEFPVELSIRPLKIGDTRTFHAFIADVTDRKRGDEALREADRIEALGKLAGEIAQDFDRLITAITRQSTFLMGCLDQDDRLRDGIEEIKNAAGQAAVLTKICWPSAAARCSIRRCWTSMPS